MLDYTSGIVPVEYGMAVRRVFIRTDETECQSEKLREPGVTVIMQCPIKDGEMVNLFRCETEKVVIQPSQVLA